MTKTQAIVIQAVVGDQEQPTIRLAAQNLSEALSATGATMTVDCAFAASIDAIDQSADATLVITSLLSEALTFEDPWPEVEARLRRRHLALAEDGRLIVYLCTVFRHVALEGDPEQVRACRTRIRRLNLLAAELSRETGLFVIDIDRALADVGGRALMSDFRLAGPFAVVAAAKTVAETLLTTGFDAFIAFEAQEAVRLVLAAQQPSRATPVLSLPMVMRSNTLVVRSGRRTQSAEIFGQKQDHVGFYVRQLLGRRMSFGDVLKIVSSAVARRGLWHFLRVVGRHLGRTLRGRARAIQRDIP